MDPICRMGLEGIMNRINRLPSLAVIAVFGSLVGGCASLGPDIIRTGRPAYNDAILATSDEQLLQNIVRLRFGDSIGFLAVSSVTASVSVGATGTINAGFGSSDSYVGNLVPFAATVTTEQSPTITYSPVTGESFLRHFGSKIPLETAIVAINAGHDPRLGWYALVRRVNNFHNPAFPDRQWLEVDPRFVEIVDLAVDLQRRGMLYWASSDEENKGMAIVLHNYLPSSPREVAHFLDLLGIKKPKRDGADVVIPVHFSAGSPSPNTISIETRSLAELLRIAAASTQIDPPAAGAINFPGPGPSGRGFHIRSALESPTDARVSARYRGRWYFIANEDESSKLWFSMLQLVGSSQLFETEKAPATVLTIPVARRR